MNVLDRIVDDTRDEVARRRERVPLAQLERALDDRPEARPFQEALTRPGVSLIAEHKRRSPSAGAILDGATVTEIVEADVLGLNNRDLTDFSVDIERAYELLADVPAGKTVVAESGYSSRDQLEELERVGVDAVLIGETLMRAPDVEAACAELTAGTEHDR